jgi:hypothetical protein
MQDSGSGSIGEDIESIDGINKVLTGFDKDGRKMFD